MTAEIRPTRHFVRRFTERLGDLVPDVDLSRKFQISGILVQTRDPDWYYLDVSGVGRLVLKHSGESFIGITLLPQIHCYGHLVSRQAKEVLG
jgi:hypothetical protein